MARDVARDATTGTVAGARGRAHGKAHGRSAPAGTARDPTPVAARSAPAGTARDPAPGPVRVRTAGHPSSPVVPMIAAGMRARPPTPRSRIAAGTPRAIKVLADRGQAATMGVDRPGRSAMISPTGRFEGRFPVAIGRVPDRHSHRRSPSEMARSSSPAADRWRKPSPPDVRPYACSSCHSAGPHWRSLSCTPRACASRSSRWRAAR